MYKNHYCLSVLLGGNVSREENGEVKIPFGSEYAIRIRNKLRSSVVADIYVDGRLVNEKGSIFLAGNQHLDLDHFIKKDGSKHSLEFVKVLKNGKNKDGIEENELENGKIEVRFYKAAEEQLSDIEQLKKDLDSIKNDNYRYIPIYIERWQYPWWYDYPYWERPYYKPGTVWCDYSNDKQLDNSSSHMVLLSNSDVKSSDCIESETKHQSSFTTGYVSYSNGDGKKIAYEVNGATANGKELYRNEIVTTNMRTEKDPVILTLKLVGYESKNVSKVNKDGKFCVECGSKMDNHYKFCPDCGKKQ